MRYYHSTTRGAAGSILRSGFRDRTGYYGFGFPLTGVWLAPEPVDINDGAKGNNVLEVVMPDHVDLTAFEIAQGPYREWCVPAALINSHAVVSLIKVDEDE
jgi:hypothetical protein